VGIIRQEIFSNMPKFAATGFCNQITHGIGAIGRNGVPLTPCPGLTLGKQGGFVKLQKELEAAFKNVRETVFPQWDKKGEWKVRFDPDLRSDGFCDTEKKMISVKYFYEDIDQTIALLVHEICHSSAQGHDKRFFTRVLKAADRAEKAGWLNAASLIRKEADPRTYSEKVTASLIYKRIADCLRDVPDASYEKVITHLASDLGMHSEEMEKKYKKCREEYDKAYREVQITEEIRKKRRELLKKI
jgi:hypothetical protein